MSSVVICVADVIEIGMKYLLGVDVVITDNMMIGTALPIIVNILLKFVAAGVPTKVLKSVHS